MTINAIKQELDAAATPAHKEASQRFFKTGPGEYGEGDVFIGVTVPHIRKTAKTHKTLPLEELPKLLRSEIHEERQCALFIMIAQFQKGNASQQRTLFDLYQNNIRYINNWDLVDCSAEHIIGAWIKDRSRGILTQMARTNNIWKRRIAVMSTFAFIKDGDFHDTLKLAKLLMEDKEDLIQKAVGWMLREIGNRHMDTEVTFLKKHYKNMPRTMLRYAIEKFSKQKRQLYLKGQI